MELRVVVIEIRVDDGIIGESLGLAATLLLFLLTASKCAILSLNLSHCSSPLLHRDIVTVAQISFFHFSFFPSSPGLPLPFFLLHDPLSHFPLCHFFSCFEIPPSCRAVWYCSNCFLQLHWLNKRKLSLMLIAHKRCRAVPSRKPTSDYFILLYQTVKSLLTGSKNKTEICEEDNQF